MAMKRSFAAFDRRNSSLARRSSISVMAEAVRSRRMSICSCVHSRGLVSMAQNDPRTKPSERHQRDPRVGDDAEGDGGVVLEDRMLAGVVDDQRLAGEDRVLAEGVGEGRLAGHRQRLGAGPPRS